MDTKIKSKVSNFEYVNNPDYKFICDECNIPKINSEYDLRNPSAYSKLRKYKNICKTCLDKKKIISKSKKEKKVKFIKTKDELQKDAKNKALKKTFGITLNDYNMMLINQNYSCAICKKHQLKLNKSLAVDHCHSTGKIRGLLCYKCNMGIGFLNDNITILTEAIEYLK